MAGDEDVRIHRTQCLVRIEGILRTRVVSGIASDRSGRAAIHDLICAPVLLSVDEVGRSPWRVAGCPYHLDRGSSELDVLAALEHTTDLNWLLSPGLVRRQIVT